MDPRGRACPRPALGGRRCDAVPRAVARQGASRLGATARSPGALCWRAPAGVPHGQPRTSRCRTAPPRPAGLSQRDGPRGRRPSARGRRSSRSGRRRKARARGRGTRRPPRDRRVRRRGTGGRAGGWPEGRRRSQPPGPRRPASPRVPSPLCRRSPRAVPRSAPAPKHSQPGGSGAEPPRFRPSASPVAWPSRPRVCRARRSRRSRRLATGAASGAGRRRFARAPTTPAVPARRGRGRG